MKKVFILSMILISIILFQGYKDKNIFKTGEDVIISKEEVVNNIVCINGNAIVNGSVEGNVLVLNGDISLGRDSKVKGELVVIGGNINKSRNAKLDGGLTYVSKAQLIKINHSLKQYQPKELGLLKFAGGIFKLSYFLIILLVVILFPTVIGDISFITENKPWKTLGVGIAGYLLIFPVAFILMLTLVGIPLLPLYFVAFFVIGFFGTVAITQLIGKKTAALFKRQGLTIVWETIIGVITLSVLQLLPFFGGIITITVYTFALGAGLLYLPKLKK